MRFAVFSLLFSTLLTGCVIAAPLSTANSKNNDSDSLKRQIGGLGNALNLGTVLGNIGGKTGNLGGVTGGLAGGKPQLGTPLSGSGPLSGIPLLEDLQGGAGGTLLDRLTGAVPGLSESQGGATGNLLGGVTGKLAERKRQFGNLLDSVPILGGLLGGVTGGKQQLGNGGNGGGGFGAVTESLGGATGNLGGAVGSPGALMGNLGGILG